MRQTFRQAQPKDANKAIPLIYASGPTTWEYVFATKKTGSAKNFIKHSFLKRKGQISYENHIVGIIDNEVVSCATHYTGKVSFKYLIQNAICIFSFYNLIDAFKVAIRGIRSEFIVKPPKGNAHYIAHVGVDEKFRGKGFGSELMEYLLDIGKQLDRPYSELDVRIDNPAYKLYKRLGYSDYQLNKGGLKNEFGKIVDHIKMRKEL